MDRRFVPLLLSMGAASGCVSSDDTLFGSSTSTTGSAICVPGQQVTCACIQGTDGVQACNEAGSGYLACKCADGGVGGGGAGGDGGSAGASGGGAGAGGATACEPGTVEPCYTGPPGTEQVGACEAGEHTCLVDGTGFGPCNGEVVPTAETCASPVDDDCDGAVNEEGAGCVCVPATTSPCYSADIATLDVGACHAGVQSCVADGTGYGPCIGEVVPASESCLVDGDEDCDGLANEEGAGCVCAPSATMSCYTGPAGTEGVGTCKAGQQVCNAQGTAYGPCVGEVLPAVETCLTPGDEDCDGSANESGSGCVCVPGEFEFCYSGPPGTADIGACASGIKTCTPDGLGFGPCVGEVLPQPENCMTPVDEDCDAAVECGAPIWSKAFGPPLTQRPVGLAFDPSGNVVMSGVFQGTLDFGGGPLVAQGFDVFLAKFDGNGVHSWSKRFGNAGANTVWSMAVASNGDVVIVGYLSGTIDFGSGAMTSAGADDIYVAKYGSSGAPLWSKRFGSSLGQWAHGVAVDGGGNVLVVGGFQGTLDFGGGSMTALGDEDVFVAKLDGWGNHIWSHRYGDASGATQQAFHVATDALGNVAVSGAFSMTIDFGGGVFNIGGGTTDFVVELDAAGNHLWSKAPPGIGVGDLAFDASGSLVVGGALSGTTDLGTGPLTATSDADVMLWKLDAAGGTIWAHHFGGVGASEYSQIDALALSSSGDVLATGVVVGSIDFGGGPTTGNAFFDSFVVRFDAAGNHEWSKRFVGSGWERGLGIDVDSTQSVVTAGQFEGSIDVGGGPLFGDASDNIYLAKLTP